MGLFISYELFLNLHKIKVIDITCETSCYGQSDIYNKTDGVHRAILQDEKRCALLPPDINDQENWSPLFQYGSHLTWH